jgi:hypothetical protein
MRAPYAPRAAPENAGSGAQKPDLRGSGRLAGTQSYQRNQSLFGIPAEPWLLSDYQQCAIENFRAKAKGALRAIFDLHLPSGLILRGCQLLESHGKHWIGLPSKSFTAQDGATKWSPVVDFRNPEARERFQKEVTPLAMDALDRAKSEGPP